MKKFNRAKLNEKLFIICMMALPVMGLLVFWLYVNLSSFEMAFRQTQNGVISYGFQNFKIIIERLTEGSSDLGIALKNTMLYFVSGFLVSYVFTLGLSYFLYKKIFAYKYFRFVFFLPSIISSLILVTVFRFFITVGGPFDGILKALGVTNIPEWLGDSRYATNTIVAFTIWAGFGASMLLFNAAMARIPKDVIEYAKIDGVSMTREFFQIILPLIWETIATMLVMTTVGIIGSSGPILLFTQGQYDTWTLSYWIFDKVAVNPGTTFELPAAMGFLMTLFTVPVVLVVKKVTSLFYKDVQY